MQFKELTEENGFKRQEVTFCGKNAVLVCPNITAKWSKETLRFRSAIFCPETGEFYSQGFGKFFNAGEQPALYPDPANFKDWEIKEKKDGTCAIFDYVNGEVSIRTRGTATYKTQANYQDFELVFEKYPLFIEELKNYPDFTFICEILSPNNVIVIRPPEIEFFLLAAINKVDATYKSEAFLDDIAEKTGIPRPRSFSFSSIEEAIKTINEFKGFEGVVVNYNKNNDRVKLKTDSYVYLHRVKSTLNSEKNLINFYVENGMPDFNDFYNNLETNFDFEIAESYRGEISRLSDAGKQVRRIIEGMKNFIYDLRNLKTRKDKAANIIASYGRTNRAGMAFKILDNKELSMDDYVKLMFQVLKK